MFFGISKKQIHISSRLNEDGIDPDNEARNADHLNRYPLAPVGRPPDRLPDRIRRDGGQGNPRYAKKDNRYVLH